MTPKNMLSNLAKLSFAVICILLLLNLVPIKIANSLILAQNPSRKRQPRPKPTQTKDPLPPNPPPQPVPTGANIPPDRNPPCANIKPPLTALIPMTDVQKTVLTSQEKPTFWFYVPYTPDLIRSFELTWDGNKENLPKPVEPGVISVSIPSTAPLLEDGKQHRLTLTLRVVCSSGSATTKPDVVNFLVQVQKLTPSQKNQLSSATTEQKAILYAQNGFWSDALTVNSELKKKNPNDENWTKLLRLARLEDMTKKTIVDCCISPSSQSSP
jgi:hypothetical protein